MTETLFYLCELILFICPTKNFIFHFFCPKYCLLLKKNQYTLIVKLLRTFVFRSAGTREKKVGGMFYFLLPIRSLSLWSTFSCLASVSASSFSIISAASARFLADFWNIRSALAKKIQDFQQTLRKSSHFLHFSSFSFLHICWEIVAELPRLKIPIIFMLLNLFFSKFEPFRVSTLAKF